jgi:hypothetical protein
MSFIKAVAIMIAELVRAALTSGYRPRQLWLARLTLEQTEQHVVCTRADASR